MEKKVRKELFDLCRSILEDEDDNDMMSKLTKTQMLYEKLVVINYLNEKSNEEEPDVEEEAEESKIIDIYESEMQESSPAQVETQKEELKVEDEPELDLDETSTVSEDNGVRNLSINERFGSQTLKIGLNDRIAFVKHLFNGEQEDYNRVLSQLNTFANYEEAVSFVENMLKPDYDWDDKEEYADRLMELLKSRFGIE